jgi:eukaryotic-like serine/threonine-protein kinase
MSDRTSSSSGNYLLLTRLADEFAARYRAGERPSLQEYIDRHPELAEDIRELLPAMVQIEQVKEDHDEAAEQAASPAPPALRQLGDFRILREVGKGGMGIVYEAEQVSLGRHVALKVLPKNMLLDAQAKRRFDREAKSAARLHHTNIVPVFGVGEQDGMPYYVMQFIQGLGLDDVLEELKKLQHGGPKAGTHIGGDPQASHDMGHAHGVPEEVTDRKTQTPGAVSAVNVARSLWTGEFLSTLDQDDATAPANTEDDRKAAAPRSAATPDASALSSSSVVLPGQSRDGSKAKSKKRTYWQSVATIGVQVAEAMEYAHKQGIHHRDIKPSNLLLDSQGTVWVTDFGLAKVDDQQNLTHTGDILGTLRYMPPEAFEGKTDARSDVYSLGLTLYEMLAFRAAFDEKERHRLIKQVTETEPDPLGKLNRQVPHDLETIVHKAIDKDPAQRYASAGALAEDLQRFIDDEPIQARRVSDAERLWRWSRRHKAIAALLALLATVLTVGCAVMAVLWSRAEHSAEIARANEFKAQTLAQQEAKASGEARELAGKEAKARREAQEQERIALDKAEQLAREDYVNRVNRAFREVQDDNVALAEDLLHGCDPKRRGWEWHFVERLCNSERRILDLGRTSVNALAYSPDGTWAVSASGSPIFGESGPVTIDVWDVGSGRRLKTLPGSKGIVYTVAVSPDGKRAAAGFSAGLVIVWDVVTGQTAWTRNDPGQSAMSAAFSPDGLSLAVGYGAYTGDQIGRAKLWDVASGKELQAFTGPPGGVNKVAFHPDGKRLAVAGSGIVEVWDIKAVRKLQELKGHNRWVYCLAYSPDGKWLATGGWDNTVKIRDAASGVESLTIFAHEGYVLDLAFSPDSRNLVTTSEDRSVRLWEIPAGRRVSTFRGHADFVQAVAFRPNGREIGTGSVDGSIRFWDLQTSRPVVVQHTGWVSRLAVRRDGLRVISETGLRGTDALPTKGWNLATGEIDATLAGIRFESLPADYVRGPLGWDERVQSGHFDVIVMSPDGKLAAQTADLAGTGAASRSKDYAYSSVVVRELQTGRVLHTLTGHSADVTSLAFSPDGRRLATASFDRTMKLWDMQTGQEVFTLIGHTAGVVAFAFSPDGNQIVSGGIDHTARVWNATPLAADVTADHDARYRKKVETLTQLKGTSDDAERAKILGGNGQWGMAADAFARAVEKEPEKLELRDKYIDALVKSGNISRAEAALNEVVKRFGKANSPYKTRVEVARTLAAWGGLLADAQELDKADKVFEQLRQLSEGLVREGTRDGVKSKELALILWNDLGVRVLEPLWNWEMSHHRPASALQVSQQASAIWDALTTLSQNSQNLATLKRNKIITLQRIAVATREAGQIDEAIARYRKAIELDPTVPESHTNFGLFLRGLGRFAESLAELKRAQELGKNQPGETDPLAELVREAEVMAAMESKLSAFLKGEFRPKDNTERLDLARVCQVKTLNHTGARLYADAFAADPKLADDLGAFHRYNAACFASLAAAGQGEDAAKLDDNERACLRKQALDWLRADLILRTRQLESSQPADRANAQRNLRHSQQDSDLVGIRDEAALVKLSEAERKECHALWGEVEALLKRAEKPIP